MKPVNIENVRDEVYRLQGKKVTSYGISLREQFNLDCLLVLLSGLTQGKINIDEGKASEQSTKTHYAQSRKGAGLK